MTDPTPYLFWITACAAGIAALSLASLSVCVGLSAHTQLVQRLGKPKLRVIHESLSLAALISLACHGLSLFADSYLHPSIADLTIPFVSHYMTLWTTIGILSGWSLALLGLSYYARNRIGTQRWRTLHRFSALAWLLGLAHSLGEGTDSTQPWFIAMVVIVAAPALALLIRRLARPLLAREPHSSSGLTVRSQSHVV